MARGRAPPPAPGRHPPPLPLRRCACSGQKAVCAAHSGPSARASALRPGLRCSLRRCRRPALAPGSAPAARAVRPGGPRRGSLAPAVAPGRARPSAASLPPAASLRLRLRPPAARSPAPRPGRCGRPWAAAGGPLARPPRRCGLPAFPWAVSGGGAPRSARARALPSLVPRSVGRSGPGCGLRADGRSGAPARGLVRPCGPLFRPPAPGLFGVWGCAAAAALYPLRRRRSRVKPGPLGGPLTPAPSGGNRMTRGYGSPYRGFHNPEPQYLVVDRTWPL